MLYSKVKTLLKLGNEFLWAVEKSSKQQKTEEILSFVFISKSVLLLQLILLDCTIFIYICPGKDKRFPSPAFNPSEQNQARYAHDFIKYNAYSLNLNKTTGKSCIFVSQMIMFSQTLLVLGQKHVK